MTLWPEKIQVIDFTLFLYVKSLHRTNQSYQVQTCKHYNSYISVLISNHTQSLLTLHLWALLNKIMLWCHWIKSWLLLIRQSKVCWLLPHSAYSTRPVEGRSLGPRSKGAGVYCSRQHLNALETVWNIIAGYSTVILWALKFKIDRQLMVNQAGIVMVDKEERKTAVRGVVIPAESTVKKKKHKKRLRNVCVWGTVHNRYGHICLL